MNQRMHLLERIAAWLGRVAADWDLFWQLIDDKKRKR